MRIIFAFLFILIMGCQDQLSEQGKIRPFQENKFFANHASARPRPEGSVAREDELDSPEPTLNRKNLERGQELYNIHCKVCHGLDGRSEGLAVLRGFPQPPDFNEPQTLAKSTAQYYQIISHGDDRMYSFADRIQVKDRWFIAQYIRALQVQQNFSAAHLTPEDLKQLERVKK